MRRETRRLALSLLSAALAWVVGAPAILGQPTENCTGADLTGSSTLPFNTNNSFTPSAKDFVMTHESCQDLGPTPPDSVVCFRPTNSCLVDFSCTTTAGSPVVINLRSMGSGACTTAAGECVGTNLDETDGTAVMTLRPLTGGSNYCFICASNLGTTQTLVITAAGATNCGALPVELLLFRIDA